jgi:hypothetical protein
VTALPTRRALTARSGLRRQRLRVRLRLRLVLRLLIVLLGVLLLVPTGLLRLLVGAALGLLRLLVRPGLLVRLRARRLLRGRQGLRRRVAVVPLRLLDRLRGTGGLRPPLPAPRLTARGRALLALSGRPGRGRPRGPGGSTVGGQHDTLVRGSCGGELLLAALSALSALRHRDSYM